jgi:hypothetical protein
MQEQLVSRKTSAYGFGSARNGSAIGNKSVMKEAPPDEGGAEV